MKKLILLITVAFLSFQVEAQAVKKNDVPDKVSRKVESMYPDAVKVKWEMHDGMYAASFLVNELKTEVVISRDGIFSSSESEITIDQLPEAINSYLEDHFPSMTIEEVEMVTDAFGIVTYEVEADDTAYQFSTAGKLLGQKSDDDDNDEEED